jgi:sec-independent protein translocase protein TatB
MFDLGWIELLIIGVTALIVIGPRDLPVMFKTMGNFVGKAKGMARDFRLTMEAAADETGLKEASEVLTKISDAKDPSKFFKKEVNDTLHSKKVGPKPTESEGTLSSVSATKKSKKVPNKIIPKKKS